MPSEKKGNRSSLVGQEVELFLKTPLFRFKYKVAGQERELLENTVRLSGEVLGENSAGIIVCVSAISNMRHVEKELPFEELYVPFDKIDFLVLR